MKLLFVHHIVSALDGSTKSLVLLMTQLRDMGVAVSVVCPAGSTSDSIEKRGFQVHRIRAVMNLCSSHGAPLRGFRRLDYLRAVWSVSAIMQLKRVVGFVKPDILHLNERGMLAAAIVGKNCRIPVVLHARNVADTRPSLLRWITNWVYSSCVNEIVAIDESVAKSLCCRNNITVIYNPTDLDCRAAPLVSWQSCAPDTARPVTFTFLAGLLPYKGVWDLMQAVLILRKEFPSSFKVIIAGQNARPPEFYKTVFGRTVAKLGFAPDVETPLRRYISEHKLDGIVQYVGFLKNPNSLLLEQSDVLVFPSRLNGTGRGVFEAGVFGIPSIVTLRDVVEDVVEDGVNGLICKEGNPADLAAGMRKLLVDVGLRKRLGMAARAKYCEQFSSDGSGVKFFELYNSILQKQGLTSPTRKLLVP